jgi:hypothetical protein
MKRLLVLLAILVIFPVGLAEEVAAGVGPASPFYSLDLFFEQIQLNLAGDELQRAKLHFKFASERIAEFKEAHEDEAKETAMELYDKGITGAFIAVEKAKVAGQDVSVIVQQISEQAESLEPEQATVIKEKLEEMKAEPESIPTGIIARSDIIVGGMIREINEEYAGLNPAYETTGRNDSFE